MQRLWIAGAFAVLGLGAGSLLNGQTYGAGGTSTTSTTVTGVTGTITQLNYGPNGAVDGFLVGTTTLLEFGHNLCGGISSLGAVGNAVTYSGNEVAATSGFETVQVTSFTNNTTNATYTAPSSTSTAAAYGPTSGTVKQLNYGPGGAIDGFLFTAGGASSAIFVSTGPQASSTLTSLLTAGATVSVTGNAPPSASACTSNGALEVVNATSLTIGSQTVVISGGGFGGGFGPGPGGPGPHH